jgi:hypothetical protein
VIPFIVHTHSLYMFTGFFGLTVPVSTSLVGSSIVEASTDSTSRDPITGPRVVAVFLAAEAAGSSSKGSEFRDLGLYTSY